ncbi:hypothetical protein M5689_014700 [Euphorbia peplus]|nr:hypothetical protein M5689_014700 [Euphorbia peplus]
MAGLQQYYFFPTDYYYPRPSSVDSAKKATAASSHVPVKNMNMNIHKAAEVSMSSSSLSLVLYNNNTPSLNPIVLKTKP